MDGSDPYDRRAFARLKKICFSLNLFNDHVAHLKTLANIIQSVFSQNNAAMSCFPCLDPILFIGLEGDEEEETGSKP